MANNTNNIPVPQVILEDAGGGMSQPWYLYFSQQGQIVGTGAPASGVGSVGNYYFRRDGIPGGHIYFKSSAGWTALI